MTIKQRSNEATKHEGKRAIAPLFLCFYAFMHGRRGLSLIETLLYTLIVGIIISGFLFFIYGVLTATERSQGNMELADAKLFVEQKLEWALMGVSAITVPAANATGGTLTLTKVNFGENPITVDAQNGVLRFQAGAGTPVPITPPEVAVSSLLFDHIVSGFHERLRVTALLTGRYATTSIDQTIIVK
ncbi:MAG: hypothetical protein Q7R85_01355 [bacterium]|nr:hypothetical protein [bacterium]